MIANAKTYFKLGVFTVLGLVALVAVAFALGIASMSRKTVIYHAYFDESVVGLNLGGPVAYRGLTVGSVSEIHIAPDKRHVDVELALELAELRTLGLSDRGQPLDVSPELRAQLGSQGITGVKLVDLDFFDPARSPVEHLPFATAENTIPVTPSLLKGLEDELTNTLAAVPPMLEVAKTSIARIDHFLATIEGAGLAEAIGNTLHDFDGAVTDARVVLHQLSQANLPKNTATAVADADTAINKMGALLDHLDGDAGVMAATNRAAGAVTDIGRGVTGGADEIARTLRDLDEAVRAVRELADTLERQPDVLLKGRPVQRSSP